MGSLSQRATSSPFPTSPTSPMTTFHLRASSCSFSDLDPFDYGFGFGSEYDSNLLPPSPLSTSSTLSSSSCSSAAPLSTCASPHIDYVEPVVAKAFNSVIDTLWISLISTYNPRCPKRKAEYLKLLLAVALPIIPQPRIWPRPPQPVTNLPIRVPALISVSLLTSSKTLENHL